MHGEEIIPVWVKAGQSVRGATGQPVYHMAGLSKLWPKGGFWSIEPCHLSPGVGSRANGSNVNWCSYHLSCLQISHLWAALHGSVLQIQSTEWPHTTHPAHRLPVFYTRALNVKMSLLQGTAKRALPPYGLVLSFPERASVSHGDFKNKRFILVVFNSSWNKIHTGERDVFCSLCREKHNRLNAI